MPALLHQLRKTTARRLVVWCLAITIPLYAWSGVLVSVLGIRHLHMPVAQRTAPVDKGPMQPLADLLAPDAKTVVAFTHPHSHGLFERHHHDRDDASVLALDAGAHDGALSQDGGTSSAGGAQHVLALGAGNVFAVPGLPRFVWQPPNATDVGRWIAAPPEHPPKG